MQFDYPKTITPGALVYVLLGPDTDTGVCTCVQTCAYVYTCKHAHVHTNTTVCFQYTVLLFCSLVFLNIATVPVFSCVSKYPFTTWFLIALWYPIVGLSLAPSVEVTARFLAQPSHSGAHPRLPKSSNRSAIIRLNLWVCTSYKAFKTYCQTALQKSIYILIDGTEACPLPLQSCRTGRYSFDSTE